MQNTVINFRKFIIKNGINSHCEEKSERIKGKRN